MIEHNDSRDRTLGNSIHLLLVGIRLLVRFPLVPRVFPLVGDLSEEGSVGGVCLTVGSVRLLKFILKLVLSWKYSVVKLINLCRVISEFVVCFLLSIKRNQTTILSLYLKLVKVPPHTVSLYDEQLLPNTGTILAWPGLVYLWCVGSGASYSCVPPHSPWVGQ